MSDANKLLYSRGNRKVGVDTIIINITSAHKCRSLCQNWKDSSGNWLPGAPSWAKRGEDLCQVPLGTCYAWKTENLRKGHQNPYTGKMITGVSHYRDEQTKVWDAMSAQQIADHIAEAIERENRSRSKTNTIGGKTVPIRYVRFQESGDFRTQADVQKMSQIASLLPRGVKAYTYTARKDLDFSRINPNLLINGSGFMKAGVDSSFQVVDKAGYEVCPKGRPSTFDCNNCESQCKAPRCRGIKRGGCMNCGLCKSGGGKVIRELLQGGGKKGMAALRKNALKGDEHGGVETGLVEPSEVLEASAAKAKSATKPTKKRRSRAPTGFAGIL